MISPYLAWTIRPPCGVFVCLDSAVVRKQSPSSPKETTKAAQAFADYVALGPRRSLRALAELYVDRGYAKSIPTQLATLKRWSTEHRWQDRIAQAVTDRTMDLLAEAAEYDAQAFLATSREYWRRIQNAGIENMSLADVHDLRGQVRAVSTKGGGVTVNVTILQEAERLAAELGIPSEDLIRDAEAIAKAAWARNQGE